MYLFGKHNKCTVIVDQHTTNSRHTFLINKRQRSSIIIQTSTTQLHYDPQFLFDNKRCVVTDNILMFTLTHCLDFFLKSDTNISIKGMFKDISFYANTLTKTTLFFMCEPGYILFHKFH